MAPRKTPGITSRKNDDGTTSYRIRWRQGGGTGPQLSHTYGRLAEAADALTQIRAAGNVCHCREHAPRQDIYSHPGSGHTSAARNVSPPTFGVYAGAHIEALTGVGVGYRARFHRELRRHLGPFLDRPLGEITDREVRVWIRGMEEGTHPWTIQRVPGTNNEYVPRPMSPTTIRRLLVQAGSVMAAAQTEGLVTRNPFRGHRVGRRREDRKDIMRMLTPAEWDLLRSELPEGSPRDLCTVLATCGLRFGEATALRVADVDPFGRQLSVSQAWVSDGRGGRMIGVPKSARSRRTVHFGPTALEALVPHLMGRSPGELVFTAPEGGPVLSSNFYHRMWRPAVDRAVARGLSRRPRIHDLRHSFASWALAEGVPMLNVSQALGHGSPQITGAIYAHVHPEAADRTATAIEDALGRRPTSS